MRNQIILDGTKRACYLLWDSYVVCATCQGCAWLVTDQDMVCVFCQCDKAQKKSFRVFHWTITLLNGMVIAVPS